MSNLSVIEKMWLNARIGVPFLFIIDTDAEAAVMVKDNLVQYITGRGNTLSCDKFNIVDYRRRFPDQYTFFYENMMNFLSSQYGRTANISHSVPTPNRFNDGYGHCWDSDADMKEVKRIRDAYIDASFMSLKKDHKEDPVIKYPAFESIAIAFCNKPSDELLAFMKQRAIEYAEISGEFKIKQCRFLEQKFSEEVV